MNPHLKGSLAGMLSAAFYGCSPALALLLYALDFDAANALLYRYFCALILMLPLLILWKREQLGLPLQDLKNLALPGICFALSTLFYFISFNFMNAGISATILFLYPIFTALIMVLVYHEKISFAIVLAIILSFGGVVLLHGAEEGGMSPIGTALAVASALTYALYIVGINRVKIIISNEKLTFYLILFSVLTSGLYIAFAPGTSLKIPTHGQELLIIFLLGLVPTIFSLELLNVAIANIGSTMSAVLGALEPVTAVFLSVIIFHEELSFNLVLGIALILLGVLIVIGSQRFKAVRVPKIIRRVNQLIFQRPHRRWRWKS